MRTIKKDQVNWSVLVLLRNACNLFDAKYLRKVGILTKLKKSTQKTKGKHQSQAKLQICDYLSVCVLQVVPKPLPGCGDPAIWPAEKILTVSPRTKRLRWWMRILSLWSRKPLAPWREPWLTTPYLEGTGWSLLCKDNSQWEDQSCQINQTIQGEVQARG